jgi:hypothetical protein
MAFTPMPEVNGSVPDAPVSPVPGVRSFGGRSLAISLVRVIGNGGNALKRPFAQDRNPQERIPIARKPLKCRFAPARPLARPTD